MFDISTFCRTCMCQVQDNAEVSLKSYNINESLGLAEKLTQCSNIKVHAGDGYPPSVCEICFVKISDFYEFQQMCRHSLQKFVVMLEEHDPKVKCENTIEEISINEDKDIEDNRIKVKCEYIVEDDSGNDPLLEINGIQLVEGFKIERLDLDISASFNSNERELAVGASTDEDIVEKKSKKQENARNATKRGRKSSIVNKGKVGTNKNEVKYENNDSSSDEELSESLSDEEESLSEDTELSDEEETRTAACKKRLRCSICPKQFILQRCLDSHMRTHQGLLDHPCPRENCGRSYRRFCDLRQHLRVHDGLPREYRCVRESCNLIFSRYGDLEKHRIEKHGRPQFYKCTIDNCEQVFKTSTCLKKHKEKRHSDGPLKPPETHMCDTCGAVLRSAATLRVHALSHVESSQWQYVCDIEGCSKRFAAKHRLTIHKNRHAGIKNYPCPHCDMRFVTSTNLKTHINQHTWERTWSCEFCPQVCNNPANLRSHIRNKHGQKVSIDPACQIKRTRRYQCSFCDKAFLSVGGKKCHELIHTREKQTREKHMRTHMKDAPKDNVCRVCGRAFSTLLVLRHHEMKHTGEKPYKCEECGISFRWPNNLTRHQGLHERDRQNESKEAENVDGKVESNDALKND